jgi:hypothetical protein
MASVAAVAGKINKILTIAGCFRNPNCFIFIVFKFAKPLLDAKEDHKKRL